mgnify:CR=1 FL=1
MGEFVVLWFVGVATVVESVVGESVFEVSAVVDGDEGGCFVDLTLLLCIVVVGIVLVVIVDMVVEGEIVMGVSVVIVVVVSVGGYVVITEVGIVVVVAVVAVVVAVDVGMLVGLKVDDSVGMSVVAFRVYNLVDVPELVGFAIVEVAMPTDELCLEGTTVENVGV